ncbi:hypothetical protein IWQ60_008547 [Tieghemiomyces parasiticus]|uniref:PH domain-containing protein n=1 Tax=Tieghemiomyces parasiticus TaxID=78921 RepID=A0A9W8A139_9FUNG|nr:hypothetical protein IWQ60_008547 [Tieghemiomyces parasiticus]
MSCDLSDPSIMVAYQEFVGGHSTNWLLLGYNDTRDVISLYSKGTGGVTEFASQVKNEVLFGLVRFEKVSILIQYISEQAGGVRRARGLVHGRAVANLLKDHDMQLIVGKVSELSETNLRSKIRSSNLDEVHDDSDVLPTPAATPAYPATITPPSATASPPRSFTGHPSPSAATSHAPLLPQPQTSPFRADPAAKGNAMMVDTPVAPIPSTATEVESRKPQGLAYQQSPLEPVPNETKLSNGGTSLTPSASSSPRPSTKGLPHNSNGSSRNLYGGVTSPVPALELQTSVSDRFLEEELAKRLTLKARIDDDTMRGKDNAMSGFIAVQGGKSYYWKRRWFVIRGSTLYLYPSETAVSPSDALELRDMADYPRDAEADVLIPNSFFLEFRSQGPFYFYADSADLKAEFIHLVAKLARA